MHRRAFLLGAAAMATAPLLPPVPTMKLAGTATGRLSSLALASQQETLKTLYLSPGMYKAMMHGVRYSMGVGGVKRMAMKFSIDEEIAVDA